MDNKYKQLFTELLHTTEILAEKVMDYDKAKEDDKGFEAAQSMRDGYAELADNMKDENYVLTKADYARIAVSVLMIISNIESRIKSQ